MNEKAFIKEVADGVKDVALGIEEATSWVWWVKSVHVGEKKGEVQAGGGEGGGRGREGKEQRGKGVRESSSEDARNSGHTKNKRDEMSSLTLSLPSNTQSLSSGRTESLPKVFFTLLTALSS